MNELVTGGAKVVELPIFDPQFKANPHPLYHTLRTQSGVVPVRLPSGLHAWVVTRHATARALLRDQRLSKMPLQSGADACAKLPTAAHPLFDHLLMADPPRHGHLRSVLAPYFSSRRIEKLRPKVQAIVDNLLDVMALHEEGDLLADFASPLAFSVVCELVGVPYAERDMLVHILQDLELADIEAPDRVPEIAQSLSDALDHLGHTKRNQPADDLLSALTAAVDHGELDSSQLPSLIFLTLAAGRETTTNLICSGVFRLLSETTMWAQLVSEPQQAARVVEELLRLESPLEMATPRYATDDIRIDGATICAGDTVFVGIAASNRDPAQFEAPDRFLPLRSTTSRHLAFGYGIHACIGAGLARLEAELALTGLCQRFPAMHLTKPPSLYFWKLGMITRGLNNLPLRWVPN